MDTQENEDEGSKKEEAKGVVGHHRNRSYKLMS
jgi:hypothetical protein